MASHFAPSAQKDTCLIMLVTTKSLKDWIKKQDTLVQTWVKSSGFEGKEGDLLPVLDAKGRIATVLYGVSEPLGLYSTAALPDKLGALPAKTFRIENPLSRKEAGAAALGWALGCYRFGHYKKEKTPPPPKLVWPKNADKKAVANAVDAIFLVRDLINLPPNDLGPQELAGEARKLARAHNATCTVISGKALTGKNYPAIYEVGKGSARPPCLIDLKWGSTKHPRVTLVGKGITFDTGGYDLKDSGNMFNMKKDMGGAAHVLGLAQMIMTAKLKVRLRVLISAAENMVDAGAYRPSDVIKTRKGLTVEVGNTDAEGRLVIADALTEASREHPKLLVDFATLTGAARVAMGPDVPAMFCNDDKIANDLQKLSMEIEDPLWRMPLWEPYGEYLKSAIADTSSTGTISRGGHIIAALFLQKFIDAGVPWIHLDLNAWRDSGKPGRPKGGEAMGMRAVYELIEKKFG